MGQGSRIDFPQASDSDAVAFRFSSCSRFLANVQRPSRSSWVSVHGPPEGLVSTDKKLQRLPVTGFIWTARIRSSLIRSVYLPVVASDSCPSSRCKMTTSAVTFDSASVAIE